MIEFIFIGIIINLACVFWVFAATIVNIMQLTDEEGEKLIAFMVERNMRISCGNGYIKKFLSAMLIFLPASKVVPAIAFQMKLLFSLRSQGPLNSIILATIERDKYSLVNVVNYEVQYK
jgi:hypothetical protein